VLSGAEFAILALWGALAVAALALTRRLPDHRGFGWYCAWLSATDLARVGLERLMEGDVLPLQAFYLDLLVTLSWMPLLSAAALRLFVGRLWWVPIPLWLAAWASTLDYESMAGAPMEAVFVGTWWAGQGLIWLAVGVGFVRKVRPSFAHLSLLVIAASEFVQGAIPFLFGVEENWDITQWLTIVTLTTVLIAHLIVLRRSPDR
jgi:hypothetical protein